ncbi:MAG: TrmB family transcriptional regulator [Bryobacterales bacterium]|nr:TrmB family transcriptional regulator [Bryobacterales bacterium]
MPQDLHDLDFQRLWRRLQQVGLNAYEARTYMVLLGHPRFKALELAARANVPRQKIYEVLDSLVEKGFTQVVQERTKLFSAVEPGLAIPNYIARRHQQLEIELGEQSRVAEGLVDDLHRAYAEGKEGRGTLEFLRIVNEPGQTAAQYRRMIAGSQREYIEFSRPPYAVDPLDEQLVKQARLRGVNCRLLIQAGSIDAGHRQRLNEYLASGIEVREIDSLPMKLALFDERRGMIALLDPLVTKPAWTAVVFEHPGMGEAMKGLFENYWNKAHPAAPGAPSRQSSPAETAGG